MTELQLKEMYGFVKGNSICSATEPTRSLGHIAGYFMSGSTAKFILDNEREIDVSKITDEKKYVIMDDAAINQPERRISEDKGREPKLSNDNDDAGDDDADAFSDEIPKNKVKITPIDNSILLDEFGLPKLLPAGTGENEPIINNIPQQQRQIHNRQNTNPLPQPAKTSPLISLLDKAKASKVKITLDLEVDAYDVDLVKILIGSFDDAKKEIVDYIISKIPADYIQEKLSDEIGDVYKLNQ